MLAETGHGMAREIFIAPVIGDLRARQLGVRDWHQLVVHRVAHGALDGRGGAPHSTAVGAFWVHLTLLFEFVLGRAMGVSWERILSDYNPARGGFMLAGLAFMFFAPMLAMKLRSATRRHS